jgi:hypothetical protein
MKNRTLIFLLAFTLLVLVTGNACSASAPEPTSTPLPSTSTLPPPSKTPAPTLTLIPPTPTITPDLAATQQYEDFFSIVQKYYDAGILPSLDGKYQVMGDYSYATTEAGKYHWTAYDNPIGNFIVRADIVLETAPSPASQSGCGFVFNIIDDKMHESIFLQRNGSAVYALSGRPFKTVFYEKLPNPAEFRMVFLVYENEIHLAINDKDVISYQLDLKREKRPWGPALLAGSTQDFGTRCDFKNIELWEITP